MQLANFLQSKVFQVRVHPYSDLCEGMIFNCLQSWLIKYNVFHGLSYSVKLWWWKSLTNLTNACWIVKIFLPKFCTKKILVLHIKVYVRQASVCHVMLGHGILKYFRPITHVRRTLLKTRIHLKERSYPIYLGHIYQRLHHGHRDQLPAVTQGVETS